MTRLLILALLVLLGAPCRAADLADLDWRQHPGAQLPIDAPLRDGAGQATTLRHVAGGLPLILAPGYFRCPNLCGVVRDDVFAALQASGLQPGRDVAVALVTIDPTETAADASAARQAVLDRFPSAVFATLSGPASSLDAIQTEAGFRARFDSLARQFLHPAGIALVSPAGIVSSYLLGVGYTGQDLRAAVARAAAGVQAVAEPVHLFCFTYDPGTGRFSVAVMEAIRLAGLLTFAGIVLLLVRLRRHA